MLKNLTAQEYVEKLLSLQRPGEHNFLSFYDHRVGAICTNPRLMLMPLDDHMAHRGDGVFETIKGERGRMYQLPEHIARLENSARSMDLTPPCSYSDIQRYILQVAKASGEDNCMVRVLIGRGPGGFGIDPAECPEASLYIAAYRFMPKDESFYKKGQQAFRSRYPARDAQVAKIKNTNYQTSVAMIREAKERGLDLAISFDQNNFLAEAAIANICMVGENAAGQDVLVVPEFTHALPGTTILRTMELVKPFMDVEIRKIGEEELFTSKELLVSGTTISCAAIVSYEGKAINDGKPGPWSIKIKELLDGDLEKNGVKFK